MDDFNSHSLELGYSSEDENGEKLVNWFLVGRKYLVYDAKQEYTFDLGRWGTIFSLEFCFVTKDDHDLKEYEENVNLINPIPENYIRFMKLIKTAASKAIPRGHRQNYIPCWSKECELLFKEYEQSENDVTAHRLMNFLEEGRIR